MKGNWGFVLSAYVLAAAVLLGYWWRVERRIRALESPGGEPRHRDPRGSR